MGKRGQKLVFQAVSFFSVGPRQALPLEQSGEFFFGMPALRELTYLSSDSADELH